MNEAAPRDQPVKVLMTADTLGGVWTYAMELCAGLRPYGVEIALATMGRKLSARQRAEVAALDHVQLHESSYRLCWMPNAWADMEQATDWLLELEAEFQPDLVHLNDLGHGGIGWQAPTLLVVHSCVCSWWQAVKGEPAPADWNGYRDLVRRSSQAADLVVAPTQAMLQAFEDQYGVPQHTQVIYNGRAFPAALGAGDLGGLREPDWQRKAPLIFSAGRLWDEAKNISLLAGAAPRLHWPVFVAGEQDAPHGERRALDAVKSLGQLDAQPLTEWLTRASVYVMPARYEPFGLSVLEAARTGCALVLGDIESLREVWGDAACYVHPERPEQLVQTLNRLAEDSQWRSLLARKAWQRAHQFSTQAMADRYWRSYQALVATAGRPRNGAVQVALPHRAGMPQKLPAA